MGAIHPDPSIERDIIELARKIEESSHWHVVKCYACEKGCVYCDYKGFKLMLFKPSHWPRDRWEKNILAKIPKNKTPDWVFEETDLNKILEFSKTLSS